MQTTNYLRYTILFCIGFSLLLSILILGISFVPFEWVKMQLDALAVDGDAEKFTRDLFTKTIHRLQLTSIGLCTLGIASFLFRRIIQSRLEIWLQGISFRILIFDLKNHVSNTWHTMDTTHRIVLSVLILSGIALRLTFLFQPMRHDEAFTFTNYASQPLVVALSNYSFPNNHLFHTFLVHLFYLAFGNHEWVIRLPAFLAGVVFLPTTYLVTRKLYNSNVALLTTAFVLTSSPLIEYTTNARGYMLVCLFFFFLLALLHHLLHTTDKAAWICFSVIGALGLYTIPTMIYPLALTTSWFLISLLTKTTLPTYKRQLQHFAVASVGLGVLTIILYTPVFLGSGPGALFSNRFVKSAPSWQSFFSSQQDSVSKLWQIWTWDYPAFLPHLLILCLALGIVFYKRVANHHIPLPLAVLTCLLLLVFQRVTPPERTWLFLLPLFLVWIAIGFDRVIKLLSQIRLLTPIKKTLHPLTVLTIIVISLPGAIHNLSNYYQYGPGTLRDAEQIVNELAVQLKPTDRVLTVTTAAPLEYYFKRQNIPIKHLRTPIVKADRIIMIVMESKYSLDEVISLAKIPTQHFSSPQLWQRHKSAAIFMLTRQQPSSEKSS